MSNSTYIYENLSKGREIYITDTIDDIAVRFTPVGDDYECFAKFKGEAEYKISKTSDVVERADIGGTILTKEQYERF